MQHYSWLTGTLHAVIVHVRPTPAEKFVRKARRNLTNEVQMPEFSFTQSINGTVVADDLLSAQAAIQGNIPAVGEGITIISANASVNVPMVTVPAPGANEPGGVFTPPDP